jgi:hypothetical protein
MPESYIPLTILIVMGLLTTLYAAVSVNPPPNPDDDEP